MIGNSSSPDGSPLVRRRSFPLYARVYNGNTTFTLIYPDGQRGTMDFPWPEDVGYGPMWLAAGYGCEILASGTMSVTFRWLNQDGTPGLNPPEQVFVLEYAQAFWMVSTEIPEELLLLYFSGVAADGFGHPQTEVYEWNTVYGESKGTRRSVHDGSDGIFTVQSNNISSRIEADFHPNATTSANVDALYDYDVVILPPADSYQFQGYPTPPPAGTVPYAQNAANQQKGPLLDGTEYYVDGLVHTNQTVQHAYQRLRETAIFFAFGHGGENFQAAQTFWNGTLWSVLVETEAARNQMMAQGLPADRIVWIADPAIPQDAFKKILLAVFMGCWTAYDNALGNPTDGILTKGADFAVGWKNIIMTHGAFNFPPYNGQWMNGAEEYSDRFWQRLKAGDSVQAAHNNARLQTVQIMGMYNVKIVPHGLVTIHPARYGQ